MSKQAVEAVLGRSLIDEEYRHLFFADPKQALAGYDLTKEERAALLSIGTEMLDTFAEHLAGHLTKRKWKGLPPRP